MSGLACPIFSIGGAGRAGAAWTTKSPAMSDPTAIAVTASFLAALVIFSLTAAARAASRKTRTAPPLLTPDAAPAPLAPPALPVGRVPTWLYRPIDLLAIGMIFLLFFLLASAAFMMPPTDEEMVISPNALLVSIGAQFLFAGIAIACVAPRLSPTKWLGLRWRSWPWVFLIAPATVMVMWSLFAGLQAGGYMEWMKGLGVEPVQDTVKLLQTTTDPLVLGLMAFAAVVAAPLCEEVVFRGYLYPVAKRFGGHWVAAICSSLVFSAAHGSLAALFPLFIFGLVLVFLYEKTGSIWAPIAVHFCFNGATVAVQMIVRIYDIPLDTGS